jgi:hypothetical protein
MIKRAIRGHLPSGARRRFIYGGDGAVSDGPPQDSEGDDPARPRARAAAWCMGAGIILGTAAVICLVFHAIVVQQAVAMALPAALLVIGGVILGSPPDAAISRRLGFLTGFEIGSLVRWLRSLFRRRGNGD